MDWKELTQIKKEQHDARVAKTPQRIEYAINQFNKFNIKFELKNKIIGHFHVFSREGKLYNFYASTGKIVGEDSKRGLSWMLKLVNAVIKQ